MAFVRTAISTTGNTTLNNATLTVASSTGMFVGMCIYGTGIKPDTVINAIAGNTITMSLTASATGTGVAVTGQYITQSGTDADPSGLSAMTGVTTIVEGSGTRLTAKYNLGLNQLRIQGTLTHNPDQYCIVGNVQLSIIIEGTYNYGVEKVVNSRFSYSKGCGLDLTYGGGIASNFPIQMRSGAFNWRGGMIRFGGAFSMTGGLFNQKGDTSVAYNNNSGTQIQLRTILAPSAMVYDKIKLAGDNSTFFWTTQTYSAISANLENGAVQTPAGFSATQTYTDFIFANNQAPADFYINQLSGTSSTLSIVKNPDSIPRVSQLNTGAYGVVEVRESLAFNVTDSNNATASNVTAYVKDTDNGARTNENQLTYVNDFDYFATGNGAVNLGDILVDVQMRNPAATSTVKHDYRGNFGATSIDFNTYLGGYDYNSAVTRQTLIGNVGKTVGWTLFGDLNISLSRANAIAKLASSFTVDPITKTITVTGNSTYDDLYDIAKAYKYNGTKANVLVPTISDLILTPVGTDLNAYTGWSLVVNNGVTLDTGVKFTKIKFTNATLNGTGKITGLYQTSAGTSTIFTFGRDEAPIPAGTSLAIWTADGTTLYYQGNVSEGIYSYYIPPMATEIPYFFAVERYGYKRVAGAFPSNAGEELRAAISFVDDIGITETTQATVATYTSVSDLSQVYDVTAYFRLSEIGIKAGDIVVRDGLFLDFADYNVLFDDQATNIVVLTNGTVKYKGLVIDSTDKYTSAKATPPATIEPTDNEQLNFVIEDANGDSQLTLLGGDNLGYKLYKVPSSAPVDVDPTTGVLLATLATNTEPFRFIGISGFDIIGVDDSSGVKRRSSMLKGVYTQAFYVGNQIQLATDAPQLVENNQKLDELILKLDTNLDAKVSTRLADADYIDPATPEQIWEYTDRTLTSGSAGGATLAEIEGSTILAKKAQIDAVETKVDALPTLSEIEATTVLFKAADYVAPDNTKIADIKTKVDTLENYNDSTTQSKLDSIQSTVDNINVDFTPVLDAIDTKPTLPQIEASTIAKTSDVTDAKTSIENKIDNIVIDNIAIADEVWNKEPERLKQVATVETTGSQIASFNNL